MSTDPNQPVVLGKVRTEAQAALARAQLEDAGIRVFSTGELTTGFRAEAPGEVEILVRQSDLGRAQALWSEIEAELNRVHPDDEDEDDTAG